MNKIFKKFFDIRQGEHQIAILMFIQIFLIISSFTVLKAVRDAVFLAKFSANEIPYLYILIAVIVGFVAYVYSEFSTKFHLVKFILATNLILVGLLVSLFLLMKFYPLSFLPFVLYLLSAIFGILTNAQFWLFANFIYNPREAKRLFSFIGTGAIAGGIFGGQFAQQGADFLGTENLLLLCSGLVFISSALTKLTAKVLEKNDFILIKPETEKTKVIRNSSPIKLILGSKYLSLISGIIFMTIMVSTFADFQFKVIAKENFLTEDTLTHFFGLFYTYLGIVSLIFQILFTSPILRKYGIGISAMILPIAMFLGSTFTIFEASILVGVYLKGSEGVFGNSINKSVMELFFMPVNEAVKKRVKAFIEMFIDRSATGIAGIFLLFLVSFLDLTISHIAWFSLSFVGIWLTLIWYAKKEYLKALQKTFERKEIDPEIVLNVEDSAGLELVKKTFRNGTEKQILYLISIMNDDEKINLNEVFSELLENESPAIRYEAISFLSSQNEPKLLSKIEPFLNDSDPKIVAEAICFTLRNSDKQRDLIEKRLQNENDVKFLLAYFLFAVKHKQLDSKSISKYIQKFETLLDPSSNEAISGQLEIAKIIGDIDKDSPLFRLIPNFLNNPNLEVARKALENVGKSRNTDLIPILIEKLSNVKLRKEAAKALSEYGDEVIDILLKYLNDTNSSITLRRNIPFVLRRFETQEAVDKVLKNLGQSDSLVEYRLIKAVNKIKAKKPEIIFDNKLVEEAIIEKAEKYYKLLVLEKGIKLLPSSYKAKAITKKAVIEKQDLTFEEIFRLLGLKFDLLRMRSTFSGLKSKDKRIRANALEFIDTFLTGQKIKPIIFPIFLGDEISINTKLSNIKNHLEVESKLTSTTIFVNSMIEFKDTWLIILSLDIIGKLRLLDLAENLQKILVNQPISIQKIGRQTFEELKS
ncbi:MAG: hypothetical protein DWQ06_01245 [Calditrichaeota bacterium]|nr:MAG: hypothetical protein DWQ06_01245 [Calditrichota bacterium]